MCPMWGYLLFLAATASPSIAPSPHAVPNASNYQPASRATAEATVSIRVMSGVRFGADVASDANWGDRRQTILSDAADRPHPAELLEFQ